MKLLVKEGRIHAALSSDASPQVPDGYSLVAVRGDHETYPWPHLNGPSACLWDGASITADPDVPLPRRAVPKRLERLEAAGLAEAAEDALATIPAGKRQRWYGFGLDEGPYYDDPDTIALLESIGAPPAVILAP